MKLLATEGKGSFEEIDWERSPITDDQIAVKSILTGICRSDIDMMQGNFGPLPLSMQGHEGLGQVIEVGSHIYGDVKIGDFVATRGEPAYADEYNCNQDHFVIVPCVNPKYILEPVACAFNIVHSNLKNLSVMNSRIAIIGSGFLSNIVYQLLSHYMENLNIEVIGSQQNNWNINLSKNLNGKYNVIIDLNSNYYKHFEEDHLEDNALLVIAAKKDKKIPLDFEQFLWKNITINCPSPRNDLDFRAYMELSKDYVEQNIINVDFAWSKCYNRNTEWKQAFEDGNNRPENYVRGYLDWR